MTGCGIGRKTKRLYSAGNNTHHRHHHNSTRSPIAISIVSVGTSPLIVLERLAMLKALERMAGSPRCEKRLIDEGLFEALVGLCFNEVASFVHGCQNYLRQRREIEGVFSSAATPPSAAAAAGAATSSSRTKGGGGARCESIVSTGGMSAGAGAGGRRKEAEGRFTEEKLEVAMDVARTCMAMFAHLTARGHGRRALHAGVLAYINSEPIGAGDDPHMTGSLSQLVLDLSAVAMEGEENRLSFVGQGPLDAIMRCLRGGRAAQQQCALDALTTVCLLSEMKPLVFCREVLGEVLMLAAVQEHVQPAAFVLHQFSLLSEWRSPLVRGGCVDLLVAAIAHATGPEAPPQEEACPIVESAVAAIRQITKLEGAGRVLVDAGGLPQLLRLSRSERENIRRDACQALKHIGHKGRDRER
ncbi:unnamed protein product, partial [Ectocarpus sp. 12 AP-2014]